MKPILCFGEFLFRFSPDANGNWIKTNSLPFFVGGAECNVASALAKWEVPVEYCTALPENYLSSQVTTYLENKKIDASKIFYHGNKIGAYYLSGGADLKHQSVIYDRSDSAFAQLKPGMIDWEKVLDGISWFHFSAISPAISEDLAKVCEEAMVIAEKKKITISVDLNYRSKLWQYGKKPREIMPQLVRHCHMVMGNIWSASMMLSIPAHDPGIEENDKAAFLQQSDQISRSIMKHFPKCKTVANTFRFEGEQKIDYYATLFTGQKLYISKQYTSDKVIDKVGSGDCFMAGLIYGFSNSLPEQDILEFATAAAFAKLFVRGDATDKTAGEIKNLSIQ
jgi:2-dehydro-3-deoxygluconokinase